jgi:hypothetical protein
MLHKMCLSALFPLHGIKDDPAAALHQGNTVRHDNKHMCQLDELKIDAVAVQLVLQHQVRYATTV